MDGTAGVLANVKTGVFIALTDHTSVVSHDHGSASSQHKIMRGTSPEMM